MNKLSSGISSRVNPKNVARGRIITKLKWQQGPIILRRR